MKGATGPESRLKAFVALQIGPSGDADVKVVDNNLRMRGRDLSSAFLARQASSKCSPVGHDSCVRKAAPKRSRS